MKKLFIIPLMTLMLASLSNETYAESKDLRGIVPPEVSATLVSPEFAKRIAEQSQLATESGRTLRIGVFEVYQIGENTYVLLSLETKLSTDLGGNWETFGSINSHIVVDPLGNLSVDGVWYTPNPEPPGGASVGN